MMKSVSGQGNLQMRLQTDGDQDTFTPEKNYSTINSSSDCDNARPVSILR